MINRRSFALSASALAFAGCAHGRSESLVLLGGQIYTGLTATPRVEALRIEGGRITALGARADVSTRGARIIDLSGATAFPGFIDSHVHLTGVGMAAMLLDLVGVESIAALQARLRTYARDNPTGPIVGRGWIETHWPERRFPTKADLDAVVADRPVFLERIDGHAAIVNTAALSLGGIEVGTPDPDGGLIERDANGAATGMLIDNAASLVQTRLPAPTSAQRREALRRAAQLYASRGWTGVSNMSTAAEEAAHFRDLAAMGEMPLIANLYLDPSAGDVLARAQSFDLSSSVRVRGVKLYADGALGSRGAALLAPYSDAPGGGLLVTPVEGLREQMRRARAGGYQVAAHAIGDRGNRIVLDAFRDTFVDDPAALRAARWRVEHAQVIAPQDIPRFAAMGVIASMQPSHAISDLYFAPSRLGPERLAGAYAWNSLLRSGVTIAAGSDAPVEKGDPLIEFYAAAYRHALDGFAGPDWRVQEAVSREQALTMLTRGGAYAAFDENELGTLAVGKRADVSALSVDLMQAPFDAIPSAHAVLTISEGRVTHEAL
jgi:predicted amidohydrolase YtcJ